MSSQPPTAPQPPVDGGTAPLAANRSGRKWMAVGVAAAVAAAGIAYAAANFFAAAEDDAIKITPENAIVYGNVFLDPSNSQKMALRDLMEKFPNAGSTEEAKDFIADLLDTAFADAGISFREDVEPWLGKQMAFFFSSLGGGAFSTEQPAGAFLLATEDKDATDATIEKLRAAEDEAVEVVEKSYEGVDYNLGDDGSAYGYVESFLVVGTETAFKQTVDASRGMSLADSDRFDQAESRLTDDRLALLYFDGKRLFESLGASGLGTGFLPGPLLSAAQQPQAAAVYARRDGLVIEGTSPAPQGEAAELVESGLGLGDEGLLPDLPPDTWGAISAPNFGETIETALTAFSGQGGISPDIIFEQLRQRLGLDIQQDILSWMGDVAGFVEGTDLGSLGGGIIVETSDPDASAAAVEKIQSLLSREGAPVGPSAFDEFPGFSIADRGAPQAIHVIAADRVIVVYGQQAALDALGTDPNLGSTDEFDDAVDALGSGFTPSGYFDIQKIIQLIESFIPELDPRYVEEVKPNLDPLTHIVFGNKQEGDTIVQRIIIGVR